MLPEEYGAAATRYRATPPPPPPPPRPKPYDGGTEQRVRKVQRDNHLPETGRVDHETLRVLRGCSAAMPSGTLDEKVDILGLVGPGDEGPEVDELNDMLDGYEQHQPAPTLEQAPPPKEEKKGFWDGLRHRAGNILDRAEDTVQDAWHETRDTVSEAVQGTGEMATDAWHTTEDKAIEVWNANKQDALKVWKGAKDAWETAKQGWHEIEDAAHAANHLEETAVDSLNSEDDKSTIKLTLGASVGVDGKGAKKLLDSVKTPGVGAANSAIDRVTDPVTDIVESLNLTIKAGVELSAEVSMVKNKTTGAMEYQVTAKGSAEIGGSAGLPLVPKGLGGNVDLSVGDGRSVGVETTYKFGSREDAIRGLKLLNTSTPNPEAEAAWLKGRKESTNFELAGKMGLGITSSKDLPFGLKAGPVSAGTAVENAHKLDGTLKLTVKAAEKPGEPDQVLVEFKNATKSENTKKASLGITGADAEAGAATGVWENEHSVQFQYEIRPGEDYMDVLTRAPKAVEFKGASTRYDQDSDDGRHVFGVERKDSDKVEYSKSVAWDKVDWQRELGVMGLVMTGHTGDPKPFQDAGYQVSRKHVDAGGVAISGKVGLEATARGVPIRIGLEAGLEIGVDDVTAVG